MGDWAKDLDSQDDSDNAKTNEDGKSEPKVCPNEIYLGSGLIQKELCFV